MLRLSTLAKHLCATGATLCLLGCPTEESTAAPGPDDVVLKLGAAEFTLAQLDEWVPWSQALDAALSEAKIRRVTLTDFLLPRAVAQGLVGPDKLRSVEKRAESFYKALVEAGGKPDDMRRVAKAHAVTLRDDGEYLRPFNQMPFDMARAAFETSVGSHSAVLESTVGFVVIAVVDKREETIEKRRILTAPFPYDDDVNFGGRVRKLSHELLSERAWVHPLLRESFRSILRGLTNAWPPPNPAQSR